jgi:large subunit ribosomal protein L21
MYAVIETGGKQYRVELGTELAVERLDALPGTTVNIDRVLLVADGDDAQIGTPTVADALVTADVVRQDRGEKIIVFKYRPKARHRSKKGHRQEQTVLRVADIRFNGRSAADEAGAQKTDEQAERDQAREAAERKAAADQELAAKLAAEAAPAAETTADEAPANAAPRKRASTAKAKVAAEETTTADDTPVADAAPDETVAADAETESKPKTTRARAPRATAKKDE